MRRAIQAALLWCLTLFGGCQSPQNIDWDQVGLELELASEDLNDASQLVESESLAHDLATLSELLDAASAALAEHGGGDSVDALRAALNFADGLVDRLPEDVQDDARLALFAARAVLRRVEAYASAAG